MTLLIANRPTSEFLANVTEVCLAPDVGLLIMTGSNLKDSIIMIYTYIYIATILFR